VKGSNRMDTAAANQTANTIYNDSLIDDDHGEEGSLWIADLSKRTWQVLGSPKNPALSDIDRKISEAIIGTIADVLTS
jgi:hypothetical protein